MKGDCVYVVKAINEEWMREGTYGLDDNNSKEFVVGVFDSKEAANKWINDNTNFVLPKVDGKPIVQRYIVVSTMTMRLEFIQHHIACILM